MPLSTHTSTLCATLHVNNLLHLDRLSDAQTLAQSPYYKRFLLYNKT